MGILQTGGALVLAGIILVALVIGLIVFALFARAWIKVARADEALVISGNRARDGESAVTVIVNGKAVVNPISQRHEVISLRSRQVTLNAEAQSFDNVTLNVEGVAIVKIGSSPDHVRRAAERFASQDKAIEQFTTEQLEGALRGIVATLTVVDLMRERKKFSDQISSDVSSELAEQGLILDSFQIKGITDKAGYISSLGTPEIEAKRQSAEIAQTNAERAIAKEKFANEEKNLVEQTALDTNTANSAAEVGKARASAEQAEALARAEAEQRVLQQRAENRQAELDADVKRVADAEKYRRQQVAEADAFERRSKAEADAAVAEQEAQAVKVRAQAEADAVRLAGEARAAAIKAEAEALKENQDALLAQRALEQLPALMAEFAKGYERVGSITVVGGAGSASDQIAGEPALALTSVLASVKAATGVDLAEVIQGRAVGQGIGQAVSQSVSQGGGAADVLSAIAKEGAAAGAGIQMMRSTHSPESGAIGQAPAEEATSQEA